MRLDLHRPVHRLVLCGLLAACIMLLTIVVAIPIPGLAGAYVNLGDAGVYLAAFVLGGPWGALCAALGSALSDILLGSMLYAGPTFVIKGLMALIAGGLMKKWSFKRHWLALLIAGIVMPIGYLIFETCIYGFAAAIGGLPANLAQYAVGIVLGLPVMRIAAQLKEK